MNACKEMSRVEWEEVRLYILGWSQIGGNLVAVGGVLCSGWWWGADRKAGNGMAGYTS